MKLRDFVAEYGMANIRILAPTYRLEFVGLLPGIALVSSSSPEVMVECEIVEDRYPVRDGYKITLRPVDPAYAQHHYYQSDLESIIADDPDRFRVYVITGDGYSRIPNSNFNWRNNQ